MTGKWGAGFAVRPAKESATSRRRAARFDARVLAFVRALGATESQALFPGAVLSTPYGPLRVTPYGDWVACRFTDLEGLARAAQRFNSPGYHRVNPYSGKFNCHPVANDLEGALEEVRAHIASAAGS